MSTSWQIVVSCLALAVGVAGSSTWAGTFDLIGGPTYDPVTKTGWYLYGAQRPFYLSATGTTMAHTGKFAAGTPLSSRIVCWDAAGNVTEIGLESKGLYPWAANDGGTVVGYFEGVTGLRACRIESAASTPTELPILGTDPGKNGTSDARDVNNAGVTVGVSPMYQGTMNLGSRPVRWDAGGTSVTALGILGTSPTGYTGGTAFAINSSGTVAGQIQKYVGGVNKGGRAIRWNPGSTTPIELGNIGTDATGFTVSEAKFINEEGTIAGTAWKYVNSVEKGKRAVRWEAGGTVATELGHLGTDANGYTQVQVTAINNSGAMIGWANRYKAGNVLDSVAVRWNPGSVACIQLPDLGASPTAGYAYTQAFDISDAGLIVGSAPVFEYPQEPDRGNPHAVVWLPDNTLIDLNTLPLTGGPAGSTWFLHYAGRIADHGWISGNGSFDPDGAGPQPSYIRFWTAQLGLGGNWLNTSNTNNLWGTGGNWSTGTPAIQRDAVFNANAAYTVALDKDQSCRWVNIAAGKVTLHAAGHALTTDQGLSIGGGATLKVTGHAAVKVPSLTLAGTPGHWTGTLDLADSALLLQTTGDTDKAARLATLKSQLASGKAGGTWLGTGITSTTLSADTTLALGDNADLHLTSFRGQTVDGDSLLLVQAIYGDVNFDNKVDAFDLNLLAAHWQQPADALWTSGDVNADGKVNAFDLNMLAAYWQRSMMLPAQTNFAASLPEPATLAPLLAGAWWLLQRRKNRRKA